MKKFHVIYAALMAVTLVSCDEHMDFPDTSKKVCDIVCTDGKILSYEDAVAQDKTPIAVVFYVNQDENIDGTGYAVYLNDIEPCAFTDSVGVKHNTSASLTDYDGNDNTHAMFITGFSPAANAVYAMWEYGQSAHIPCVAEMNELYGVKDVVNPYIIKCGGTQIPSEEDDCWYWTSTEVEGQESYKAWLYSLGSSAMQETPKDQIHKIRPIITLRN